MDLRLGILVHETTEILRASVEEREYTLAIVPSKYAIAKSAAQCRSRRIERLVGIRP